MDVQCSTISILQYFLMGVHVREVWKCFSIFFRENKAIPCWYIFPMSCYILLAVKHILHCGLKKAKRVVIVVYCLTIYRQETSPWKYVLLSAVKALVCLGLVKRWKQICAGLKFFQILYYVKHTHLNPLPMYTLIYRAIKICNSSWLVLIRFFYIYYHARDYIEQSCYIEDHKGKECCFV